MSYDQYPPIGLHIFLREHIPRWIKLSILDVMRDAVTGAFGYTGKYITKALLAKGREVVTLTGHPDRPNAFRGHIHVYPFHFDQPDLLTQHLKGVHTLYNTYWVRFEYKNATFDTAIENTKILFGAAKNAGVSRIVHTSIANPSEESPLPYYRGKALVERFIKESGISYAILRPTVIFGSEDILVNNIAWMVRSLPVFAIMGSGQYKIQPIFVEDFAELAVDVGDRSDSVTLDAVGPEVYTFNELVRMIANLLNPNIKILHVPAGLGYALSMLIGLVMKDVVLTRDEVKGLLADLLYSGEVPTGKTRLSQWLKDHKDEIGRKYASEITRHYTAEAKGSSS